MRERYRNLRCHWERGYIVCVKICFDIGRVSQFTQPDMRCAIEKLCNSAGPARRNGHTNYEGHYVRHKRISLRVERYFHTVEPFIP
jgi:hypothetical protein